MAYRESDGGNTQTPDERRAEMNRLLLIVDRLSLEPCDPTELRFIADMRKWPNRPISQGQLYWMRSLKDRLL